MEGMVKTPVAATLPARCGQGAHEAGHKKRHIPGTAFARAKDGQDYFNTGIDYFSSCKYRATTMKATMA
ncbi:hypothetical protein [Enterocloster sp.]|uniref:hypothetical protein n=1 Tax=Enterocloster sp. TaxID=2719315 RepID=UPI0039A17CF2